MSSNFEFFVFFRIMIIGSRPSFDGCPGNDVCHIKLRLTNMRPSYTKCFPVFYSVGVMNVDGVIDCKTDVIKTSSSELIALFGNEVEIFTKSKLNANKSRFLINDAVTFVCQVRIHNLQFQSTKFSISIFSDQCRRSR